MTYILRIPREAGRRSLERSRAMERRLEVVSRAIWPWHHAWLVPLVALLAALDLLSTYAFLELSGKPDVYESGQLAAWGPTGTTAGLACWFSPGAPTWPFSSLTRW